MSPCNVPVYVLFQTSTGQGPALHDCSSMKDVSAQAALVWAALGGYAYRTRVEKPSPHCASHGDQSLHCDTGQAVPG